MLVMSMTYIYLKGDKFFNNSAESPNKALNLNKGVARSWAMARSVFPLPPPNSHVPFFCQVI